MWEGRWLDEDVEDGMDGVGYNIFLAGVCGGSLPGVPAVKAAREPTNNEDHQRGVESRPLIQTICQDLCEFFQRFVNVGKTLLP